MIIPLSSASCISTETIERCFSGIFSRCRKDVFVMLLSVKLLKETVTLPRIGGALLIVAGAVLLRLA